MTSRITGEAPYTGLRPYEPHESHLFFGRDEHIVEMFSKLESHRFLAVVGSSGAGKSSLVRAGLLPRLREEGLLTQRAGSWRFLIMRPGDSALYSLARACHEPDRFTGMPLASHELHGGDVDLTQVVLASGPKGLLRILEDARLPATDNVLLLVDQFEEVFRFAASGAVRDDRRNESIHFVSLLLETAMQSERPVHVVLTMRTDFIGDCDRFDGLPQAINNSQFLTPRLSWRQLEQAITGPLQVAGYEGTIERDVVDYLFNAAMRERDSLPLIQHILLRMWLFAREDSTDGSVAIGMQHVRRCQDQATPRSRELLPSKRFEETDWVAAALEQHAEEIYSSLATPPKDASATHGELEVPSERQRLCRHLFCALSGGEKDGRRTRRLTTKEEVIAVAGLTDSAELDFVLAAFACEGCNFLIPSANPDGGTSIDISHESLLRHWPRLDRWLIDEAENVRNYRRLAEGARQYFQQFNSRGAGDLLGSHETKRLEAWWDRFRPTGAWVRRHAPEDPDIERSLNECREFIELSKKEHSENDRHKAEEIRRTAEFTVAKETAFRMKCLAILATVFGIIAVPSAMFGVLSARRAAAISERAAEDARKAERTALADKHDLEQKQRTINEQMKKLTDALAEVDKSQTLAAAAKKEADAQRKNAFGTFGAYIRNATVETGFDQRIQVFDTSGIPFRWVCHIDIASANGTRLVSTGFLFGPRQVLTTGYSVYNHDPSYGIGWVDSSRTKVFPGGSDDRSISFQARRFFSTREWIDNEDDQFNYGCIELESDVSAEIGWAELSVFEGNEATTKKIGMIGYPADKGGNTQWMTPATVFEVTPNLLRYRAFTSGGMGGALLIKVDGDSLSIVGLHAMSTIDGKSGPKINRAMLDQLNKWKLMPADATASE